MENFFSTANGLGESTGITKEGKVSTTGVYIAIVLFLLVLGLILYWYFKPKADHVSNMGPWILNDNRASTDVKTNSIETIFTNADVQTNLGNNFTLSFFVYMDDVNRERIPIGGPEGDFRFKPFVYILGVGDVLIDPIHQIAYVRIKPLDRNGILDTTNITKIELQNFMVARWNQLTITLEGRTVDVYLNGVLAGSALMENVPIVKPVGVLMEKSPEFAGQGGLFQAWPRRLSEEEVARNYARNTDTRRKPLIPDKGPAMGDIFKDMGKGLCSIGFCGFRFRTGPMEYVDYEFA